MFYVYYSYNYYFLTYFYLKFNFNLYKKTHLYSCNINFINKYNLLIKTM